MLHGVAGFGLSFLAGLGFRPGTPSSVRNQRRPDLLGSDCH
jgi:hypothetical protein